MKHDILLALGKAAHPNNPREKHDFYATDPKAVELLLEKEKFSNNILEPACGQGHLSKRMTELGYSVTSSDLIDRGYGDTKDFFAIDKWNGDIITNPPYKYALDFVKHGLMIIPDNAKIAMFLRLVFLESRKRKEFFEQSPHKYICVQWEDTVCLERSV